MQLRHLKSALSVIGVLALLTPLLADPGTTGAMASFAFSFQSVVEVMFGLWLVWLWQMRPKINWRTPIFLGLAAFFIGLVVTWPFSLDPSLSFWSTYIRLSGIFSLMHLAVWLVMLSTIWTDWEGWLPALFFSNVTCLIIGIYGLTQYANASGPIRIGANFGNSLTLASYALLHIPLALLLAYRLRKFWLKAVFALSAAFYVAIVILTASRGAFLSLLVVFSLAIPLFVWTTFKNRRIAKAFVALVVVLAASAVGVFFLLRAPQMRPWVKANLPLVVTRMTQANLGADRLALWDVAWRGFKERPLVGYGLETYGSIFDRHFDPKDDHAVLTETWYDKPHNLYLEWLSSVGIVGSVGLLALLVGVFWSLIAVWRKRTETEDRVTVIAIGAVVVAYMVQATFLFVMLPIELVLFTVLGMLAALHNFSDDAAKVSRKERRQEERRDVSLWPSAAALVVCVILAGLANGLPYRRAWLNDKAWLAVSSDPQLVAQNILDSLEPETPYSDELRVNTGSFAEHVHRIQLMPASAYRPTLEMMAEQVLKRSKSNWNDYRFLVLAANTMRPSAGPDRMLLDESNRLLQRALEIAPQRFEAYEQLAENAYFGGDLELAREIYGEAYLKTSNPNRRDYLLTRFAGLLAYAGKYEEASKTLEEISLRGVYNPGLEARPAQIIAEAVVAGNVKAESVTSYFRRLAGLSANSPLTLKALAIYENHLGNYDKAQEYLETFAVFRPDEAGDLKAKLEAQRLTPTGQ